MSTIYFGVGTDLRPKEYITLIKLIEIQDKFSSFSFLQNNGEISKFYTSDNFFKEFFKF